MIQLPRLLNDTETRHLLTQITLVLVLVVLPVYYFIYRPFKLLGELRDSAQQAHTLRVELKESVATAPMPMVKYRNRLFPRLYLHDDHIEYHILRNKSLNYSDMDSISLSNRSMFNYTLEIIVGGANKPSVLTFSMKADAAEQVWEYLQHRCEVQDQRIPWS